MVVALVVGGAATGDVRVVAPVCGVVSCGVTALVKIDVSQHLAAVPVPLLDQVPIHQQAGSHVGSIAAPSQDQFLIVVRAGHHGEVRYRISA